LTLLELAANIRAAERLDLERQLKRGEPSDTACHFCGHTFRAKGWDKWEKARYSHEAKCFTHDICLERHQEQTHV